jgi:hypothetical protein
MAISGGISIKNSTMEELELTDFGWINDVAEHTRISKRQKLAVNESLNITMSNESFLLDPKGIGVELTFTGTRSTNNICIYFEVPAVGSHTLKTISSNNLHATYSGGDKNLYYGAISS